MMNLLTLCGCHGEDSFTSTFPNAYAQSESQQPCTGPHHPFSSADLKPSSGALESRPRIPDSLCKGVWLLAFPPERLRCEACCQPGLNEARGVETLGLFSAFPPGRFWMGPFPLRILTHHPAPFHRGRGKTHDIQWSLCSGDTGSPFSVVVGSPQSSQDSVPC